MDPSSLSAVTQVTSSFLPIRTLTYKRTKAQNYDSQEKMDKKKSPHNAQKKKTDNKKSQNSEGPVFIKYNIESRRK